MKIIGIIPARYFSTRFPKKILTPIGDKTMLQHVYERAKEVLNSVYIATDHVDVVEVAKEFTDNVIITPTSCLSGTERCKMALQNIEEKMKQTIDVVVNIQGDEPLLNSESIIKLVSCFQQKEDYVEIATLIKRIDFLEELLNESEAKVVFNEKFEALYFSRSPIPYVLNEQKKNWMKLDVFYKHIGIYAFKASVLKQLDTTLDASIAKYESLEQNNWLAKGYKIKLITTKYDSIPVDTYADLKKVIEIYNASEN